MVRVRLDQIFFCHTSFGQAVVRQLPVFLQIFLIDALFALFIERHQRAFEMLSRTRTVREA